MYYLDLILPQFRGERPPQAHRAQSWTIGVRAVAGSSRTRNLIRTLGRLHPSVMKDNLSHSVTAQGFIHPMQHLAFIGGGNMASALIGGLRRQGVHADQIHVVEPFAPTREALLAAHGVQAREAPDASLSQAHLVVWAVKPQVFKEAAEPVAPYTDKALHLSVAAGILTDSIAAWLRTERVVRAMPNTPALIGQGQTGLYARTGVSQDDRLVVEQVMSGTGQHLWVDQESLLDAVTAISGSGPAYVFYFIEAMSRAAERMGLTPEQARQLSIGTFCGAAELARRSTDSPATLRERVTSKGGTTYAALTAMQASHVADHFEQAMEAARLRAAELGETFGR